MPNDVLKRLGKYAAAEPVTSQNFFTKDQAGTFGNSGISERNKQPITPEQVSAAKELRQKELPAQEDIAKGDPKNPAVTPPAQAPAQGFHVPTQAERDAAHTKALATIASAGVANTKEDPYKGLTWWDKFKGWLVGWLANTGYGKDYLKNYYTNFAMSGGKAPAEKPTGIQGWIYDQLQDPKVNHYLRSDKNFASALSDSWKDWQTSQLPGVLGNMTSLDYIKQHKDMYQPSWNKFHQGQAKLLNSAGQYANQGISFLKQLQQVTGINSLIPTMPSGLVDLSKNLGKFQLPQDISQLTPEQHSFIQPFIQNKLRADVFNQMTPTVDSALDEILNRRVPPQG